MKPSILLVMILAWGTLQAQEITGIILDSKSGDPLAFVAVVEQGTSNGVYSDIDGRFMISLRQPDAQIEFRLVGYHPLTVAWSGQLPWMVSLEPNNRTLSEVVILPGENPAERIMRKVIENKHLNNPEYKRRFSYDSYNKLVVTADVDSVQLFDTAAWANLDTTNAKIIDFFRNQHILIMESATQRKFMPPDRSEETILATRVSGLSTPTFALLGTQLQSFSFYGEEVHILDVAYLSPLSEGALRKYLFIIEDTTFADQDTVFTISFRPRKGRNFNGMSGQLFIHTNGYALRNVIAEPSDAESSIQIRIQQQYQWTPGGWFPDQLNSFLRFPDLKISGFGTVGVARSYIRNLRYDEEFKRSEFGPIVLLMDPKATEQPDSVWNSLREHALDQREINTYRVIDSLGKAENFDRKMKVFEILSTGKIPVGWVNIDLDRLLRFNDYEGWRLGAGLHTNDFFSRRLSVGGYYAYGFKDRDHKYGGDLLIHLYRKRQAWLRVGWERDVQETGGRQLDPVQLPLLSGNFYPVFISRMDRYEQGFAEINGRIIGNLTGRVNARTSFIQPYQMLGFYSVMEGPVSLAHTDFRTSELGISLRWAPGERLARVGEREVRLGGRFPVVYLRYTKGFSELLDGDFGYERWDALVEKVFRITNVGELTFRAVAGYLPGTLPVTLYYNVRGTNTVDFSTDRFMGLSVPFTFQTMRTNEFLHQEFAAVHVRHTFRDLLLSTPGFRPHVILEHSMMWGSLKHPEQQLLSTRQLRGTFMESGLVIDRLFVSNFSGFGLGFFYRYGPNALERPIDNFVVKLSTSIAF